MIAIIDIGIGNVSSVAAALRCIGADYEIVSDPIALQSASHLIFAGVGNYGSAVHALDEKNLRGVLRHLVLEQQKPILGICLGMQLLGSSSEEAPGSIGLDLLPFAVKRLPLSDKSLRTPHVGWNEVYSKDMPIFNGIPNGSDFYFVHSYYCDIPQDYQHATCPYGISFPSAVQHKNIVGAQFHPEKSQVHGLKLLRNFLVNPTSSKC